MRIQLKEIHALIDEDGAIQNFFGTPFTCQHKDCSTPDKPTQFIAEWFADVDADEAEAMLTARRVDAAPLAVEEKQDAAEATTKKDKKAK